MVKRGHALTRKFRKIKQFGAFLVYTAFQCTSMKFITNDSAARKQQTTLHLQGPHGSLKSLKVFKNMKSMKSL